MQVYILMYKVTRSLFDQLLADLCFDSSFGHKDDVRQLLRRVSHVSVWGRLTLSLLVQGS